MGIRKIAYISDHRFPRTSTDTEQIISMVSALGLVGFEVTLASPAHKNSSPMPGPEEIAGYYSVKNNFEVYYVKGPYPFFRGFEKMSHAVTALRDSFLKKEFDLFYTRNLPVLIAALLFTQKPVLFESYRPWPSQNIFMRWLFKLLAKKKRFIGIIVHSEYAAKSYINHGMASERVLVAHNGIWPERFQNHTDKKKARSHLKLSPDGIIATYTGRVNKEKGLEVILSLAVRFPSVTFLIVGSEEEGEIEIKARKLPNVKIYPWQSFDDLPPFLYASDILIIPPTDKPLKEVGNTVLPMKTFLYLASKRAILAPSSPDLLEILTDGVNAKLAVPDDLESICSAMSTLIEQPETRRKLGEQAYHDVIRCSWENRAGRIGKFICERYSQYRSDP